MPRNGSGSFSIPNTYSDGQTITASVVNANFSDIASELTNSVARDGQTSLTGPVKASNGTAAAPSYTFGADTDTGFYRVGANQIGVSAGGSQVGTFPTAAGAGVFDAFPSGTAMLFVQTAAPTGWTKSVAHDNKALRVVSGTASSGGSSTFTDVFSARTITQANLPNVSFTGTAASDGAHTHTYDKPVFQGVVPGGGSGGGLNTISAGSATGSSGAHTHTVTVASGGSGTAVDFEVQYVDVIIATKD
jgi:hypothetical protein